MDDPNEGATLMEVPRVLADAAFRKRLLDKCQNVVVKDFWIKEAEKAGGEAALANVVPYITSKFNTFIAYINPGAGYQFFHLVLQLTAKGALELTLFVKHFFTSS